MGFATKTTGHVEKLRRATDRRTLRAEDVLGFYVQVFQRAVVTTEEWRGLSWADAESLDVNTDASSLGGVERPWLGGVRVTVASGNASSWITVFACWGTEVRTEIARVGDTDLFDVFRRATDYSVEAPGVGSISYI